MIEFTQYEHSGEFRYKIGWFMTTIMGFTLFANVSCLFYKVGTTIITNAKSFIQNRVKTKKMPQEKEKVDLFDVHVYQINKDNN